MKDTTQHRKFMGNIFEKIKSHTTKQDVGNGFCPGPNKWGTPPMGAEHQWLPQKAVP